MTPSATSTDAGRLADLLSQAERAVVLTGAGISAESGIPTFRASDGLWESHRIEDVATPEAFRRDPAQACRDAGLDELAPAGGVRTVGRVRRRRRAPATALHRCRTTGVPSRRVEPDEQCALAIPHRCKRWISRGSRRQGVGTGVFRWSF